MLDRGEKWAYHSREARCRSGRMSSKGVMDAVTFTVFADGLQSREFHVLSFIYIYFLAPLSPFLSHFLP